MLRKLVEYLLQNEDRFRIALSAYKKRLSKLYFEYPSPINSGYLHIDRIITLMQQEGLATSSNECILDIGAASGEMINLLNNAFPNCHKYAFEPRKKDFEKLVKKFADNSNFHLVNKAVGAEVKSDLKINTTNRGTSSSLLEVNKELKDDYFSKNIKTVAQESITLSTLDQEIPKTTKVSLIKIDVQGFELEVLKGAKQTLANTSMLLIEMQNHQIYKEAAQYYEIDEFVRSQHFTLFEMIPSIRRNGKLYEWDAVYVNQQIADKYLS